MINDAYAECLVERKRTAAAPAAAVLIGAGILGAALSILRIGLYGFLLLLLVCLAAKKIWENLHLEYEYLFVEQRLTIDKIYNKSRRKKAAEYALENIEVIGPEHAAAVKEWDRRVRQTEDYTSGKPGTDCYVLIHQMGGICKKVRIEPDENLIRCMRMAAPQKMARG